MVTRFQNLIGLILSSAQNLNPSTKAKTFEELEGLRGYSAFAVLLSHLIYGPDETVGGFGLFSILGSFAHTAVLIFFVLSGFVIGYTTHGDFSIAQAKTYLAKRFVRLYPIYLICLILSFWVEGNFDLGQFVGHLVFMQGWFVKVVDTNGPLWSLHCEALFYLLFLVLWRFKIHPLKAVYFCAACGVVNLFFKWHLLKILGYFSIWMIGFWIAKNREKFKETYKVSQNFSFWSAIALSTAFISANALEVVLMTFNLKNDHFMPQLPSVVSDVLIGGLIGSIVTSTMGYRIPGLRISQAIAFVATGIAVGYALWKGLLPNMQNYQTALFFLVCAIGGLWIKSMPLAVLRKASYIGSVSYALYVIHRPLQLFIYQQLGGESGIHYWLPNFWYANFCVVVVTVSLSILLECHFQPWIAVRLKQQLKMT